MSVPTGLDPMQQTGLPGARVIAGVRRLIVVAVLATVGYGVLTSGSKGYCPGGTTADGGFVDSAGDATETAPNCIALVLEPSPLLFIAIVAIVVGSLTIVLRRASDEASAIRILDRTAVAIALLTVGAIVISQIWFSAIPIAEWDGTGSFSVFVPFGSVDLTISPMTLP